MTNLPYIYLTILAGFGALLTYLILESAEWLRKIKDNGHF